MKTDLQIALCGLSARDQRMVHMVLANNSGVAACRNFQVVDPATASTIEMVIVDEQSVSGMDELQRLRGRHPGVLPIYISDDSLAASGSLRLSRRSLLVDLLHVVNAQAAAVTERPIARPVAAAAVLESAVKPPAPITTIGAELAAARVEKSSPITVLIVDADKELRSKLQAALLRIGVKSVQAADAEEALACALHRHFDLIFLDVALPRIDGYQLCRELLHNLYTRSTPVLMLTSQATPYDRARGAYAGCTSYLVRPLQAPTFYETVDKVLLRAFHNDRAQLQKRGYRALTQTTDNRPRVIPA